MNRALPVALILMAIVAAPLIYRHYQKEEGLQPGECSEDGTTCKNIGDDTHTIVETPDFSL